LGGSRGRLISSADREQAVILITEACNAGARKSKACDILGLSMRTVERWEKENGFQDQRKLVRRVPMNKLTQEQRNMVISTTNNATYRDLPPCKIVPLLADVGQYIASESTFYRILRAENQLTHRLASRSAKHHRPEAYEANGPNQVWTWDISYLPTQVAGLYVYLYMIVDIYSRKIVGFSVHDQELSSHAANLIMQACMDEGVLRDQLVLHSDNGVPMKGATMLATLEKLGVVPSFSRPSVSDDNPYSEALFRTVKYHPTFPMLDKFGTILDARQWSEKFVCWYNNEHLHSALKFVTPQQRHSGADKTIRANRHLVYQIAKAQYPERWTGQTRDWSLPDTVNLNPNKKNRLDSIAASNDGDLTQALDLGAKLLEQERLDGAGNGSRQVAVAARQYG
jgi:transposase InsO family protein